ncbi:MAG: PIG-L deacetylase family protein [Nocardioides marinisabuli]|uniref:PIG-L deacetylase family protein n=1 Tax=Nocardioides marinisabuli TaxID=419476 RepID=UPI003219C85D
MSGPISDLPPGLVREAVAPERLVVVWTTGPVAELLEALGDAGHLPVLLEPAETLDLVDVSGAPSMLMVDPALLDDPTLRLVEEVRRVCPQTRVVVLAGSGADGAGLLRAMRAGLTEVVDPAEPGTALELLGPRPQGAEERVLAVGAHPDDIEIGCGATLLRHRRLGHAITVLTLSRGAVGGRTEQRRREAAGAAMALSAELLMGDLPDTRIGDSHDTINLVEAAIAHARPTTVYVHSKHDHHQDHRAVHEATVIAARRVPQLYCYQSPSSRNEFAPTKFVPVRETIEEKVELLAHYRSQAERHYLAPDLVVATARYWARQLPHARYAEPFEVLRASEHEPFPTST